MIDTVPRKASDLKILGTGKAMALKTGPRRH